MDEKQSIQTPTNQISSPFTAITEVFYNPRAVFDTLSVKDNWSWIPFILIVAVSLIPGYLYFNTVDFSWYAQTSAMMALPEGSPAEIEAIANTMTVGLLSTTTLISVPLGLIIVVAILGGYYTLWTRNDEKSVHGFTDWYGAMWWIMMPTLISSVLACLYIAMQPVGSQIAQSAMAPLSLSFILGLDMTNTWYALLESIRLDTFWSMALAVYCLKSWTNFSTAKSIIVALIPNAVIWAIVLFVAL